MNETRQAGQRPRKAGVGERAVPRPGRDWVSSSLLKSQHLSLQFQRSFLQSRREGKGQKVKLY